MLNNPAMLVTEAASGTGGLSAPMADPAQGGWARFIGFQPSGVFHGMRRAILALLHSGCRSTAPGADDPFDGGDLAR